MNTDYDIWSFVFAWGVMPCDTFGGCPIWSNKGTFKNPMTYSVIQGGPPGHPPMTIAVDTGFRKAESMSGQEYENIEMPDVILPKVGLHPVDVEAVILTHMHFDHMGNIEAFPNARIYVQKKEYLGWKKVLDLPEYLKEGDKTWIFSSFKPPDMVPFERAREEGRLHFLEGNSEIFPGIICHLAEETHTFGSQWIEVRTSDGPYVLAGDCVYWYENLKRMWPPGYIQGNSWHILRAYGEIRELIHDDFNRVVPTHEPKVFERHQTFMAGLNPVAEIHRAKH